MSQRSEVKRVERDRYVLGMLPSSKRDAVALVDIVDNGWRFGTVRASLNRLLAAKASVFGMATSASDVICITQFNRGSSLPRPRAFVPFTWA